MKQRRIFLDTDVVISSLLSYKGAAFSLFIKKDIQRFISTISKEEIKQVGTRLQIDDMQTQTRINDLAITTLDPMNISKYEKYVLDQNDAHIVAGAHQTSTDFLITYNMKHYMHEAIRIDLEIIVMTPGMFLQYLRSIQ